MEDTNIERGKTVETDVEDEDFEDYERYFEEQVFEESDVESEDEEVAIRLQEEALISWKNVVLITFDEKWTTLILCSTMVYFFFIIYSAGFAEAPISKLELYVPLCIDILYAVDVLLIIVYKIWSQLNSVCVFPVVSNSKLTFDVLSIVPLEWIFFNFRGFYSNENRELAFFRFNRLLRLFRLLDFFNKVHNTVSHINVTMHLLEWLTCFLLFDQICAVFLYLQRCFDMEECWSVGSAKANFTVWEWYIFTTFVALQDVGACANYPNVNHVFLEEQIFFFCSAGISFFIIWGYLLGYLTSAFIHQKRNIFIYCSDLNTAKMYLAEFLPDLGLVGSLSHWVTHLTFLYEVVWRHTHGIYMNFHRVDEQLKSKVIYSNEEFWKRRSGIKDFDLYSILPAVMIKQACVDIYWPAFKHSHLLRNMDMCFMYSIATKMKYRFCLPGEIIFKQNELKNKMVYIVSGVVQVISEVNEETPIISFSAGTCLGESTVLFSYCSSTDVVCSTFSEIMILERSDLLSVLQAYPFQRKYFNQYIFDRYKRAEEHKALSDAFYKSGNEEMKSLLWLKTIMQLLNDDKKEGLVDENSIANEVQFTPMYLDLYVMTQELELVKDPVCLKSTCPCVLQPDSEVLDVWNVLVVCIAIIAGFLLPYYAFLACLPIKYKDNLHTGSSCGTATNANMIQNVTTLFFLADILIQMLTAVRTRDQLLADWKDIFLYRITEPKLLADILATLPFEVCTDLVEDIADREVVKCTFSLNRLLKLWKLETLFVRLENSMTLDIVTVRFIRYIVILIFGIYYSAVLLYGVACYRGDCRHNSWFRFEMQDPVVYNYKIRKGRHITISLELANAIWTGKYYQRTNIAYIYDMMNFIIIIIIASFVLVCMVAGLSATKILKASSRAEFKETIIKFKKIGREQGMNTYLQQHLLTVLKTKWQYLHSISTLEISRILHYASSALREEVQIDICFKTLCHVPLFQGCSSEFVKKVAASAEILVTPSKMTVFYTGEVAKEMYVIINGYCEVLSNLTGKQQKILGPNDHFGAVEIFLNIPCATTVCTITSCRLASIKVDELRRVITMFPAIFMDLKEVVSSCSKMEQISKFHSKQFAFDTIMATSYYRTSSFYSFGKSSSIRVDYYEPFKHIGYLGVIRYLSLPVAVMPDGHFVKWWEGFRFFFAFASCLWFPARIIMLSVSEKWTTIIDKLLDITAYLDIYVRMHVSYYNEDGILVKHPIKTASHYIKHGFLLDLLGCVPIELLQLTQKQQKYSYFPLLRVVQVHRIFSAFRYLEDDILHKHQILSVIKYMPFYLIAVNFCASCMCTLACEFDETIPEYEHSIYGQGVTCSNESWIHKSVFANYFKSGEKLTPLRVYLYGVYLMTSLICQIVFAGVSCVTDTEVKMCFVISLIAYVIFLGAVSSIVASRASHNMDLTFYQEKMFRLVKYINNPKIPNDLRSDIIKYFEFLWAKKQGEDIMQMLRVFHFTLREDLLITIYGKTLKECVVLSKAGASFCRVLLENMTTKFILKRGIIINFNDICDEIYIIHKGRIEVSASNGTKLLTLHKGSMVGNFELQCASRQTLMMQARSHVELLIIKTAVLERILRNYPHLRDLYVQTVQINRDFVTSVSQKITEKDEDVTSEGSSLSSVRSSRSSIGSVVTGFGTKIYSPYSIYYKVWEVCILICGAFLNYVLLLYQAALQEHSIILWSFQYIIDIMYIIKIFLKFHLAFEDEFGDLIVDLKRIALMYMKDPYGLYLDILTTLPFEVFAFAVDKFQAERFLKSYSLLHLNRLPRIVFLIQFFHLNTNKLNINVVKRRFMYILVIVSLYLHTLTCIHAFLKYITIRNWSPFNFDFHGRISEYMDNLWISTGLFFSGSFDEELAYFTSVAFFYVLAAIISILIQIFIIGEMCAVLETVGYTKINYANKISTLKGYLRLQDLSSVLLNQIWHYVLSLWDHNRGTQTPSLLKEAPGYLMEAVKTSLYGQLIYTNYVFCRCQADFLRQVIFYLKEITFFPGNYIAFEGEINDSMYFIFSGEVEVLSEGVDVYFPNREDVLRTGDVFGMIQGLYPLRMHKYSYRALTITVILILQRQDWEYLLRFFPDSNQDIYERATSLHFTI